MRLYVGGFPYSTTKEELSMLFSEVGEVIDIHLPFDREQNRPRGFGFIEMPDEAAAAAIERFHGTEFGGRTLTVNEAKPRADEGRGGGDRGGDRGGFRRRDDRPRFNRDDRAPREERPAMDAEEAPAAPAMEESADEATLDMPAADADTQEEGE